MNAQLSRDANRSIYSPLPLRYCTSANSPPTFFKDEEHVQGKYTAVMHGHRVNKEGEWKYQRVLRRSL